MAVILPHIEDSNATSYIPPSGEYEKFENDAHYEEKVREWGLSTTREVKKEFWYKERTHQRLVTIKGYQSFGEKAVHYTLVIEFQDGNLSCIHSAYLKEMQSSNFGKEIKPLAEVSSEENTPKSEEPSKKAKPTAETVKSKPVKEKKEKPAKIELPEDKVHFTGKVKQFAMSWNHFNEENDEVVILENVRIETDVPIEVGLAWCSHSKTLKKLELTPGDDLDFNGKIVKKSLPKGKDVEDESLLLDVSVPYKINNPSKLSKL